MVRIAGQLTVNSLHGTDRGTVLDDDVRHVRMLETESLHAGVIATVKLTVDDSTDSQTCAERVADEVVVTLRASGLRKPFVDFRKHAAESLAIGVKVAVIIDINRDSKSVLKEWSESDTVTERREVRKITADDSVRVIGRAREAEADRDRFLLSKFLLYLFESCDHRAEAAVKVVGVGRKCDWFAAELSAFHRAEDHVGAAGVEGHNNSAVISYIRHILVFLIIAEPP